MYNVLLCNVCANSNGYGKVHVPAQLLVHLPSTPDRPVAKCDRGIYLTLEWTQPDDVGAADITGYVIQYRGSPCLYSGIKQDYELIEGYKYGTVNVAGNTTKFQFTDELEEQMRYEFAVATVNAAGQGQFSQFSDNVDIDCGEHCCD